MNLKILILPFHTNDVLKEFDWQAPTDDLGIALNQAFREFNVVEEGDPHIDRQCRSMGVGDLIQSDGKTYLCCPVGWREIDPDTVEKLKTICIAERMKGVY